MKNTYKQKKEEYGVTFKTSMNYPSTLATTTTNPQLKEDNKSNSQSTSPKLKPKTDSNLLIKSKSGVMITSKTKANNVNNIPKKEVMNKMILASGFASLIQTYGLGIIVVMTIGIILAIVGLIELILIFLSPSVYSI